MVSHHRIHDLISSGTYHSPYLYRCNNASDAFTCLVSVDPDTLSSVNDAVALSAFYETLIFIPIIEGKFIVKNPVVTINQQMVNSLSFICHHLSIISSHSYMYSV